MTRPITEINVHCSATRPGWMGDRTGPERVAEIRRWHVEINGWRDIGYHWLIDRDGAMYRGRPEATGGAFEPRVNARGIGICLLGGFGSAASDAFEKHYTPEQDDALRALIASIKERHPGIKRVSGHNEYSSKACPGFSVPRWYAHKPAERSFAESGTALGSGAAVVAGGGLAAVEAVPLIQTLTQTTSELKGAVNEARAVEPVDPLRWVLLVLILAGAAFALYRRWADWQRGRK
jgi:N-acetylmuramoyl-L-alanine amidase